MFVGKELITYMYYHCLIAFYCSHVFLFFFSFFMLSGILKLVTQMLAGSSDTQIQLDSAGVHISAHKVLNMKVYGHVRGNTSLQVCMTECTVFRSE